MSEDAKRDAVPATSQAHPGNATVEALLTAKFPMHAVMESFASLMPGADNSALKESRAAVQAERARLLALSPTQLGEIYRQLRARQQAQEEARAADKKAKQEAKAAKADAAKFYNQPAATADLEYWAKHEYWTFDEAIALLLGKNPQVVTLVAVKRELAAFTLNLDASRAPSEFIREYDMLRNLALRAQAMTRTPQLQPIAVLAWAEASGATQAPPQLVETVVSNVRRRLALKQQAEAARAQQPEPPQADTPQPKAAAGTTVRWNDEDLAKLKAYREQHGTKAAAEKFGISPARIRALLPKQRAPVGQAHDPFGTRRK